MTGRAILVSKPLYIHPLILIYFLTPSRHLALLRYHGIREARRLREPTRLRDFFFSLRSCTILDSPLLRYGWQQKSDGISSNAYEYEGRWEKYCLQVEQNKTKGMAFQGSWGFCVWRTMSLLLESLCVHMYFTQYTMDVNLACVPIFCNVKTRKELGNEPVGPLCQEIHGSELADDAY